MKYYGWPGCLTWVSPASRAAASASSESSSARAVRQAWNSRRIRDSTAAGPAPASSGKLSITAFVRDLCPLARTNDHAEAVITHRDTPGSPGRRFAKRPRSQLRRLKNKLGLLLAPLKSSALRDWETRVTGKSDVPRGAHAAEVGGASLCLVELRMPAGSAEPWLRTQLQPPSIRRAFRHETQNMPLSWALAQPGLCPALSQLRPAPVALARTPPPNTPGGTRG